MSTVTNRSDLNTQAKAVPATDTGSANAYAVSLSAMGGSYYAGMPVVFTPANTNTGASTINVNSLGTKTIKKQGGTADVAPGDIQAGAVIFLVYDGTNFQMLSASGSSFIGIAGVTIDGGGSAITTGQKGYLQVPYAGTIVGWSVIADQSGNITVDIDKHSSSAPPSAPTVPNTSTDKISASAPISLSSAQTASAGASGVSTWSTTIAQWDVIGFNVTGAATITRVTIELQISRR